MRHVINNNPYKKRCTTTQLNKNNEEEEGEVMQYGIYDIKECMKILIKHINFSSFSSFLLHPLQNIREEVQCEALKNEQNERRQLHTHNM